MSWPHGYPQILGNMYMTPEGPKVGLTKTIPKPSPHIYQTHQLIIDDIFENIILTLNHILTSDEQKQIINPDYKTTLHLKQICESLTESNEVNAKIKSIIVDIWYHNYVVSTTYQRILKKLFDETIYDFTIKFPDGKFINCLKVVIQKIPYFEIAIKDYNFTDSMILDDNYCHVTTLIKMVYMDNVIDDMPFVEDAIDIVILGDKYLMSNDMAPLLKFIYEMCDNKKFIRIDIDKLLMLHVILTNLSHDQKFIHTDTVNRMLHVIHNTDLGENIFKFENYDTLFNHTNIINAIKITKKYELLNSLSGIEPLTIISFLIDINFKSNIYYKLKKQAYAYNMGIIYKLPSTLSSSCIVIHNYYPNFNYTLYFRIKASIKLCEFGIELEFDNNYNSKCIKLNDKIIIGTDSKVQPYTITKIFKYHNGQKVEIDNANHYIHYPKITYEIYFDRPVEMPCNGNIYVVKDCEHLIEL
jgi:hypothetical protein